jgi:hypothetical protein
MVINSSYFFKATENGKASIHTVFSESFTTHMDNPYPLLPMEVAEILCEDLNEINARNTKRSKRYKRMEFAIEQMHNEFLENELRESFTYCVLSTIIERNRSEIQEKIKVALLPIIHWDRLFRITPQPPSLQNEMAVAESIKPLFASEWKDLPLNYASNFEEIGEEGYGFVGEDIIMELNSMMADFDSIDSFVVDLLYQYIDRVSITIPILWVAGKISDALFVDAFRVFSFEQSIVPDSKKLKEQRQYFIQRMQYLRKAMNAIDKYQDEFEVVK